MAWSRQRIRYPFFIAVACIASMLLIVLASGIGGEPALKIVFRSGDGNKIEAMVARTEYIDFLDRAQARIALSKRLARERAVSNIDIVISRIIEDMDKGVDEYADWYFTWGTTHTVVYEAAKAYGGAIGSSVTSPREAAAATMQSIFEAKFIELVVKPDVNQGRMTEALTQIQLSEKTAFDEITANEIEQMLNFVRNATASWGQDVAFIWTYWAGSEVIDWTVPAQKAEALLGKSKGDGLPSGLPSTGSVDFSDMARTALIQSAVNNILGFTTSLAAPTLTVLDTGTAMSTAIASVLGPFAPFFTPEMLIIGTGIAMVTDYGMIKAAEYSGRDELRKSARSDLQLVKSRLSELFHQKLDLYYQGLYGELAGALPAKS